MVHLRTFQLWEPHEFLALTESHRAHSSQRRAIPLWRKDKWQVIKCVILKSDCGSFLFWLEEATGRQQGCSCFTLSHRASLLTVLMIYPYIPALYSCNESPKNCVTCAPITSSHHAIVAHTFPINRLAWIQLNLFLRKIQYWQKCNSPI